MKVGKGWNLKMDEWKVNFIDKEGKVEINDMGMIEIEMKGEIGEVENI